MQISTQTDKHNFNKDVATNKKYILRKMTLKFQNPKFSNSYKMAFWDKKKQNSWIRLYASRC